EDSEADERVAGHLDTGEIKIAIVRNFVELAGLGPEDTDEVLGVSAGELGCTAPDFRDEEAADMGQTAILRNEPRAGWRTGALRNEPNWVCGMCFQRIGRKLRNEVAGLGSFLQNPLWCRT
ncbi:MAG: hypothetical protein JOY62_11930, partial [Acidobacteriaceae bacterium]|nr:hypothetical protein [Acidobacteriaceae bacterium]